MTMKLLATNSGTFSTEATFTSGIDSTYKLYIFKFYDVNPATDTANFEVNFSIDGGSNYNVAKTTSFFYAYNGESASPALSYQTARDLQQGTGGQQIASILGNRSDESAAGELFLFNPASTTYVKHFYSITNGYEGDSPYSINSFVGGYANVASDNVDAVQFQMSSGNMDAVIKMYGVG
jgi:hypothetical protein